MPKRSRLLVITTIWKSDTKCPKNDRLNTRRSGFRWVTVNGSGIETSKFIADFSLIDNLKLVHACFHLSILIDFCSFF
jgi:hypothetical protein